MGAIGWLARTRLDQSRQARAVGNHREAAAAAEEAASLATAAGLDGIAAACAEERCRASSAARSLSKREREVIALLAGGASNKDIAGELAVSINTVERHLVNIYSKLAVRGRAEATAFAVRNDLA
jgi:DNA-binding NarL/FixJ family response regulator